MQFNLTKTAAKLNSFNIRAEKHGEENVPAGDLKLTIKAANTILDIFDPELRTALYKNTAANQGQEEVAGLPPTLPNLRFPNLDVPLKLKDQGVGYTLVLDWGLGGDSNLTLEGCEVNNFQATLEEGGTVELAFRVQISNPDADVIGKLGVNVQHEITIDLTAPKPVEPANVTPIKRTKRMTKDEAQAAAQALFLAGQDEKDAAAGQPAALTH